MKVIINPDFEKIADFIKSIPEHKFVSDNVYRNLRNTVEEVEYGGVKMVIKQFKKPTVLNRFVYSFIRPTKAKRSYKYSMILNGWGFETPKPIAYIEISKNGLFHTGYFISEYTDYKPIKEIEENINIEHPDPARLKEVVSFPVEFSKYCVSLHEHNFIHGDFNKENVLFKYSDGKFHFSLIDLNRARFNVHSKKRCFHDLSRLGFTPAMIATIVKNYCAIRNIDLIVGAKHALANIDQVSKNRKLKHKLLAMIGIGRKAYKERYGKK